MENRTLALVPATKPAAQIAPTHNAVRAKDIQELKYIAEAFAVSGAFPDARTAAQAFVKIMAGQEYNIGPMASMLGVFFIKDKPALSATLVAGQIKKHPIYDYRRYWLTRVKVTVCAVCDQDAERHALEFPAHQFARKQIERTERVTDELNQRVIGCDLEFYESGTLVGRSVFTDTDQAAAGLNGDNWRKYPRSMFFARAMTSGARAYCPDVFGGAAVFTPEELDPTIPVDAEGRPMVLTSVSAAPAAADDESGAPKPPTLRRLQALFAPLAPLLPKPEGAAKMTLGLWLSSSIAPGLEARRDPITGRNLGLTDPEKFAAETALETLLLERAPEEATKLGVTPRAATAAPAAPTPTQEVLAPEEEAAPFDLEPEPAAPEGEVAQAQLAFAGTTGATVVYAPPGSDAHKALMAKFTSRKMALGGFYPAARTDADRRHAFARDVLGAAAPTSSKQWSEIEYRKIMDALDRLAASEPTL